ncbi:hypothetical protein D3C85_1135050 [compost metagenome]
MVATTRMSNVIGLRAPTLSTSRSCSTRSNLAWSPRGISEISSSRMVPPSACSNLPACAAMAPVKEPFSCPNKVASSMLSGIAAQLIAMNG